MPPLQLGYLFDSALKEMSGAEREAFILSLGEESLRLIKQLHTLATNYLLVASTYEGYGPEEIHHVRVQAVAIVSLLDKVADRIKESQAGNVSFRSAEWNGGDQSGGYGGD